MVCSVYFIIDASLSLLEQPFDMKCGSDFCSLLSLWEKFSLVTIQMKAAEQYFPVVLFIMLYKVVLTFESVVEILKCDQFK